MTKYVFPAIFSKEKTGLYFISFPDLESCFTQGDNIQDGLYMASDVLNLVLCDMEDRNIKIPYPSDPKSIVADADSFVTLVIADTLEYRKTINKKSIKKTLTIPQWLDEIAIKENVNFSNVLQNALMEQLDIHK